MVNLGGSNKLPKFSQRGTGANDWNGKKLKKSIEKAERKAEEKAARKAARRQR